MSKAQFVDPPSREELDKLGGFLGVYIEPPEPENKLLKLYALYQKGNLLMAYCDDLDRSMVLAAILVKMCDPDASNIYMMFK